MSSTSVPRWRIHSMNTRGATKSNLVVAPLTDGAALRKWSAHNHICSPYPWMLLILSKESVTGHAFSRLDPPAALILAQGKKTISKKRRRNNRVCHSHSHSHEGNMKTTHSDSATTSDILLTEREAARVLRLSTRTLLTLRKTGQLPFVRVGAAVRYRAASLEKWAAVREQIAKA